MVTLTTKLFSFLLHNYIFATVMNHNVNIFGDGDLPEEPHEMRITELEQSKERMAVLIVSCIPSVFKNRLMASCQRCWIRDSVCGCLHVKSLEEEFYHSILFYWDRGSCYVAQITFKLLDLTEPVTSQILNLSLPSPGTTVTIQPNLQCDLCWRCCTFFAVITCFPSKGLTV